MVTDCTKIVFIPLFGEITYKPYKVSVTALWGFFIGEIMQNNKCEDCYYYCDPRKKNAPMKYTRKFCYITGEDTTPKAKACDNFKIKT